MSATATDRLYRALTYPLLSVTGTVASLVVAALAYGLLIASTDPAAAAHALSAGVGTLDEVLVTVTVGTYEAAGPLGLALTVAYALLAGVTVVTVGASVAHGAGGLANLLGAAPGVVVAGCASCGAGLLPLLGAAGAYALFPFGGTLVRAGGVAVLLVALARTGDPRRCEWN
ncbi:MAG: hypothetical protein ACOCS7_03385 [Halolamina sp.]